MILNFYKGFLRLENLLILVKTVNKYVIFLITQEKKHASFSFTMLPNSKMGTRIYLSYLEKIVLAKCCQTA